MEDRLLSREQERQVKRLRFDGATEESFQEAASKERIRRIQLVVVLVALVMFLTPPVKDFHATALVHLVSQLTGGLTLVMLGLVFVPKLRRMAVYALPVWEVAQHAAFQSVFPALNPFAMAAMQMAMAIIIVAAVRAPAMLSLIYAAVSLAISVGIWNLRGLSSPDFGRGIGLTVLGLFFLVVGAYLTEVADRRSFLVSRLLEAERSKTEALLSNVLPATIAEKLKASNGVIATSHPSISVLFADVVNFTPFAAERPASEVVGFLNDLFSRFDVLVRGSGLEKIKTVGDAYMVAGGLPEYREDHLEAMADLALEMRGAASAIGAEVRFGLHAGPAVAGVIGTQRYMYDIWGSTVNLAARLESASSPGEIQVSHEVREALSNTHEFKERGALELKGVGSTEVFVLVRRQVGSVRLG